MLTQPQQNNSPKTKEPNKTRAIKLAYERYDISHANKPRFFLSLESLSSDELTKLIQRAIEMKLRPHDYCAVLRDKAVALIFQKTSTRTRCSFELGIVEMSGHPSYIDWRTSNFVLADLQDEIKVMSRYYDGIVARVNDHATLEVMASHSETPVINGMCNLMHPCQALGDYMTLAEYFGPDLQGLKLTYIGDGNNVCRSLVHGAVKLGVQVTVCTPPDYALDHATLKAAADCVTLMDDPFDAVHDADVVYTDTWVSIGQEGETEKRIAAFKQYQINESLMTAASGHALFMHCLPAHPGFEVTAGVLRGPISIVVDQAENRKHAQKALMQMLMG